MYAGQYVNQAMSKDLQTQALESGEEIAADDPAEPKTAEEFRVERLTWFGLVGVLVITGVLPDWLNLHRGITPLVAGLILIISGILQYRRGWRVSFSTWVAGTLLLVMSGFGFVMRPDLDLSLAVIVIAVLVIATGVFTRES